MKRKGELSVYYGFRNVFYCAWDRVLCSTSCIHTFVHKNNPTYTISFRSANIYKLIHINVTMKVQNINGLPYTHICGLNLLLHCFRFIQFFLLFFPSTFCILLMHNVCTMWKLCVTGRITCSEVHGQPHIILLLSTIFLCLGNH